MRTITKRARITGQVQGVAYRAWTKSFADSEQIRGWVRNADDGSVVALLSGPEEPVERMLRAFWEGPAAAAVRHVQVEDATAPDEAGFHILP